MTDDVTWPRKVKVVTLTSLKLNISKIVRDRRSVQMDQLRKLHIRSPMVMWLMTSRDPKRSSSWPQKSLNRNISTTVRDMWSVATNRKPHIASPTVTWPMTSRDSKRSKSWPQNLWSSIPQQACEIHRWFILTTNRKPHTASPLVMWLQWSLPSRDPNGQGRDSISYL